MINIDIDLTIETGNGIRLRQECDKSLSTRTRPVDVEIGVWPCLGLCFQARIAYCSGTDLGPAAMYIRISALAHARP